MSAVVFIPARYASTRYPGKPLVELTGATDEKRSLIRRSWELGRVSITRLNEAQNALIRAQANLATSRIRVLIVLENLRAATNSNRP